MALSYLDDIKPLEDQGYTDSQIASYYSQLTTGPISCGDAKILMEEAGAVVEDPVTQARTGSLITHYETLAPGPVKQLLAWFITHCFGRGDQINSHLQPRASQVLGVVASLPAGELRDLGSKIVELGGGQPNLGLVASDISQARSAWQAGEQEAARREAIQSLQAEIENTWINPAISDGVSDSASVRAAIKAGM